MHKLFLGAVALTLAGCSTVRNTADEASPYLILFAGDQDEKDEDFLAVLDLRPGSAGTVISSVPVGLKASMPHHMEYALPPRGEPLFVNAHHHEETLLVDVSKPTAPAILRRLKPPAPYRFTHDYWRLPNGNRLVGFLRSEGPSPVAGDPDDPGNHGGIAEYTSAGGLIRTSSAAVAGYPEPIRPYAFAPVPRHDRLVTTGAEMMETNSASVVQIWRFSDLKLLHTLRMPKGDLEKVERVPFEPRLMADGSVLINAYGCGLYRLTGIEGDSPLLTHLLTFAAEETDPKRRGACGVPVVDGRWWVMPVGRANRLVTLDISDPAKPRIVSRFDTASDFRPHWTAKDPRSDRIVVGAEHGGEQGMLILRLDPRTGALRADERVRAKDGRPGYLDLAIDEWPHGRTGAAWALAALFMPDR
jgi:hypothetical protein